MLKILNFIGMAYWVEVITDSPQCTYYFGPFSNQQEADGACDGYLEDLESEGAKGIKAVVKRCKQPTNLTVFNEVEDYQQFQGVPALSRQGF
ncbi:MAG: DUF1816 domain-containing protein [Cyanobacteria bacterium P01_G01_bin.49]